ncbi:cah [Symbiodinium natans]|uniref:carbonic anhydrase n=1 Tax=Symbiodinium natans TaxID=878477 RepID=A0A812R1H4_9DINO|nr:cah [Symbiodinium natans]
MGHGLWSAICLWLFARFVAAQEFPTPETWKYEYPEQQYWKNIVDAQCGSTYQSPIDIPKKLTYVDHANLTRLAAGVGERLGPFAWSLAAQTVNVTLHPGPLTWDVRLVNPEAVVVQIGGLDYKLESISFKTPSEHTVEGGHNAMEIQMRHVATTLFGGEQKVLMVSISLRLAANVGNSFLTPIWSTMPVDGKGAPSVFIANPYSELAPPDRSYVRYTGSTTTPPCERAEWIVFMEPGYLGIQQLQQFRSSISGYQPSRLAPANSTLPTGVSESWDSRWGRNNRLAQDLGFREVQMVQMMNVDANAVPKLTAVAGMAGNSSWEQLNIYWIIAITLLVLACIICGVWLLRAQLFHEEEYPYPAGMYDPSGFTGMHGRELHQKGCCEVSDSEEEMVFQPHAPYPGPWQMPAPSYLHPFPEQYMYAPPGRSGFGKQDQIYIA